MSKILLNLNGNENDEQNCGAQSVYLQSGEVRHSR